MADRTPGHGLRERKKLRTRATLIEVAAELCVKHGYDNTTVEQIAAAADVSPRTFSRYFPTKESVVTAVVDEMDVFIADALERQPGDIDEYEALLRAHLEVFGRGKPYQTRGFTRMAVLIQIVNASASIKATALGHQRGVSENAATRVMAERLGVTSEDPSVAMIADMWTVLFASSFAGLGQPGNDPVEPGIVCDRLCAAVDLFRRSWSPFNASGHATDAGRQPPASARIR